MVKNLYQLASYTEIEVRWDETEFKPLFDGENFFGRLARMRQYMIDRYLEPHHTDVLWIDADVIEFQFNLYERLRATSETAIMSPIVLIEDSENNYDTAGMREDVEERSSMSPPWFNYQGEVVPLVTTGCVVVVPADIHRNYKFYAQPDDDESWNTEWLSICRDSGAEVLCDTRVKCYHADLMKWEGAWH